MEAWRFHKEELYLVVPPHMQLHLFFICTDRKMPVFEIVEKSVIAGVRQLCLLAPFGDDNGKVASSIGAEII